MEIFSYILIRKLSIHGTRSIEQFAINNAKKVIGCLKKRKDVSPMKKRLRGSKFAKFF